MKRNTVNVILDGLLLIGMLCLLASGLVIRFVLPPGSGGRHGETGLMLWRLGRHDWGDVHFWAAAVISGLLALHVALHWSWVCANVRRGVAGTPSAPNAGRRRGALGLGALAVVCAAVLAFVFYSHGSVNYMASHRGMADSVATSVNVADDCGHEPVGDPRGEMIRGSMTLSQLEAGTGLGIDTLKARLGLPAHVSADERLGRLSRQYGFTMDNVRALAAR